MSAGLKPANSIHLNTVKIMLEDGMDIGDKRSQLLARELQEAADIVVCSGSSCPFVKAKHVEEWSLPDPTEMPLEEATQIKKNLKSFTLHLRLERRGFHM